jgi:hypothetical protein
MIAAAVAAAITAWPAPPATESPTALPKARRVLDELTLAVKEKRRVRFSLNETDAAEYIRYVQAVHPRPWLKQLTVKFFPGNYISTYSLIDFDEAEKVRPGSVPKLLRPLLHTKSVWLDARVSVNKGLATYHVEKAYVQGVRIPVLLVEKAIQVVGSTRPARYDTTKPIPVPYGVRWIATGRQTISGGN